MATLEEKYQRKITRAQVAKDHTIYKIEKYRDSLATDKDMVLGDIVGGAMVAALFLTTALIPANVLLCPVISFAIHGLRGIAHVYKLNKRRRKLARLNAKLGLASMDGLYQQQAIDNIPNEQESLGRARAA